MSGRKRARPAWESAHGWQRVTIGDELLIGSEEGGFLELEELRPTPGLLSGASGAAAAPEADEAPAEPVKKSKLKRRAAKQQGRDAQSASQAPTAAEGPAGSAGREEDVAALKAQLAALEAENRQLKAGASSEPATAGPGHGEPDQAPATARSVKLAAKKAKAKEVRAAKKAAAKARKARSAEGAAGGLESAGSLRKRAKLPPVDEQPAAEAAEPSEAAASLQQQPKADVRAWEGYGLGPAMLRALAKLGFEQPTPIQAECLLPAIRDRRDIIGAAQTGSGKTLAFGLPILQLLLAEAGQVDGAAAEGGSAQHEDADMAEADAAAEGPGTADGLPHVGARKRVGGSLRALIVAPTRELAMQVCEHLQAVARPCGLWVAPIVGGISPPKQARLLRARPEVVVGTPGRLWELMRDGEPHLADLRSLAFLVLDEADRMVQQGHYQELSSILELLDSQRAAAAKGDWDSAHDPASEPAAASSYGARGDAPEEAAAEGEPDQAAGPLQTFVFSATLTLPQKLRRRLRKGGGASGSTTLEQLMERLAFRGKPKVADLTSARRLADKVVEAQLRCSEDERDAALYALLAAHPGRSLVFVNAVSAARRVAALLALLRLPAQALHAGMQQRARLKALARFRSHDNAVLVASDVAARGLDIAGVRCVVHYQVPASADVYVHRCGRTARAGAEGLAVTLVTPRDAPRYAALLQARAALGNPIQLGGEVGYMHRLPDQALERGMPPEFPLAPPLLRAARERLRLAVRLDAQLRSKSKASAERAWLAANAEAAGVELSDDEDDADVSVGEGDDAAAARGAGKRARRRADAESAQGDGSSTAELQRELDRLLAQPLQARFSRRFFTGVPSALLESARPAHAPVGAGAGQKGEAAMTDEEAAAAAAAARGAGVARSVRLAQSMADSQAAAKARQNGRQQPGPSKGGAAQKKQQPQRSRAELEAEALAAALRRREAKKGGMKGRGGGAVLPPQSVRGVAGPDALAALRARLGRDA